MKEKGFVQEAFEKMQKNVSQYANNQNFMMSNVQLFTFLSNVPASFAVAGDGVVDANEIKHLEKLAKGIDVNMNVSLELSEAISMNTVEPEGTMTNEEFNLRVGAELLYLSRHAEKYEANFIEALKALLSLDSDPASPGSLTASLRLMMDNVVKNNLSENKETERKKMDELKQKIGLI